MAFLLAGLCGLAFGSLDQYLGSLISLGPWAVSVSGLSAPWLVLPFAAGLTQTGPRRAMLAGLVAVAAALLGYFVMTVSRFEGVPVSRFATSFAAIAQTNLTWIVGGVLTAPLFGVLGQRWRVRRWWGSAAMLAGCLCLEPAARWLLGRPPATTAVWLAEIAAGLCLVACFAAAAQRRRAMR